MKQGNGMLMKGFLFIEGLISPDREEELAEKVSREFDRHGADANANGRTRAVRFGLSRPRPIPSWLSDLDAWLCSLDIPSDRASQITLNEYLPGAHIVPHVDPQRETTVISLLADAILVVGRQRFEIPRRSTYWLGGKAHELQHEVLPVLERRLSIVLHAGPPAWMR